MDQDSKLLTEAYGQVERHFQKGDIVELPVGWQRDRGYFADWAQDVTHGEVWGMVIDRNVYMTGDIEVTLLDPETREPLGQGLSFRPDELRLAESIKEAQGPYVPGRGHFTTPSKEPPFPPVRNIIWAWEWESSDFSTEASTLQNNTLDPWNRPLPHKSEWDRKFDREGDVLYWQTTTTVRGTPVKLTIFND